MSAALASPPVATDPALRRLAGRVVVVKYGGAPMSAAAMRHAVATEVATLAAAGVRPVVVHGGGPQITAELDRQGVPTVFAGGLRVTTPETMRVVRTVLVEQVNRGLVELLAACGAHPVGVSGDDGLLTATRRRVAVDGTPVELGQVGDVAAVAPARIAPLLAAGRVPVVATVARGADGLLYNVNADTAAAALAVALGAARLVVLSDVAGLYADWPACTELLPTLDAAELTRRLPGLDSGMAPKMEACLRAVHGGVSRAHVADGRRPGALLAALAGASGGTTVTP